MDCPAVKVSDENVHVQLLPMALGQPVDEPPAYPCCMSQLFVPLPKVVLFLKANVVTLDAAASTRPGVTGVSHAPAVTKRRELTARRKTLLARGRRFAIMPACRARQVPNLTCEKRHG